MSASSSKSISKTVFIIGAGASKEANLPIGSELKKSIAKALDIRFKDGLQMTSGDDYIVRALHVAVEASIPPTRDITPFLSACRRIRDAMPQAMSIDNFIDVHSEDKRIELCGKLAIVRTILEAEAKSSLFIDPSKGDRQLKYEKLEETWLNSFLQLLTENCKPSDLENRLKSVALIVFNYDRCIEHFLYHALQNYYSLSIQDVVQLIKHLEIYHPYGTAGTLPWLDQNNAIHYGGTPHPQQLLTLADQIKTFTEGTDESSSDVNAIRSNVQMSHRIVFLGFAFHRLNLEFLLPKGTQLVSPTNRRVFASALGISKSDIAYIAADLANRGAFSLGDIQIRNDLTCSQLFREYWRSMSFV